MIYDKHDRLADQMASYVTAIKRGSAYDNHKIQSNLSALGFYTGPINGDLSSEVTRRAISNFQKVYGLNPTDGNANTSFRRKLNEAVSVYENVITNPSMPELANNSKMQFDYNQIHNFAKVWTFLNVSMGLNTKQIAGVMGNMHAESGFYPTNAENNYYPGKHNPEYVYSTTDRVGYGLIQWTDKTRKQGLLNEAIQMGLDVSDLNAQLAFFRKEMLRDYSGTWNKIKKAATVQDASDIFLEKIEKPKIRNYAQRREYSDIIYAAFS